MSGTVIAALMRGRAAAASASGTATRINSQPTASSCRICSTVAATSLVVYLPRGSDGAALLWRSRPDSPVFAVPVRRVLSLVALLASLLVFAVLLREEPREQIRLGALMFGGLIGAAVLLGWIMYPFPL